MPIAPLAAIAAVVVVAAGAFVYTAGFLLPVRLSPETLVGAFGPPKPGLLCHRRNHAKGVCFTGRFDSNGVAVSRAVLFAAGASPVIGRFNLGTTDPAAPDGSVRIRGLSIDVKPQGGGEWRSGMITAPFFPVSTPRDFSALLTAGADKDPGAMGRFVAAHPGFPAFVVWNKYGPWTGSYAEERYNGLNSFLFTDHSGATHAVRWSMLPAAPAQTVDPATLKSDAADMLERDITARVQAAPQRWTLQLTVAANGDQTADPASRGRPTGARSTPACWWSSASSRKRMGRAATSTSIPPCCRTAWPRLFPAARSAAYAVSFNRRTAEAADYPRTRTAGGSR